MFSSTSNNNWFKSASVECINILILKHFRKYENFKKKLYRGRSIVNIKRDCCLSFNKIQNIEKICIHFWDTSIFLVNNVSFKFSMYLLLYFCRLTFVDVWMSVIYLWKWIILKIRHCHSSVQETSSCLTSFNADRKISIELCCPVWLTE